MPIYDYQCKVCKYKEEVVHKMDDDRFRYCMACAENGNYVLMNKLFSSCRGLHFKGSGFYETDYK